MPPALFFGKTATRLLASVRPLALLTALLLAPWGRPMAQGQALPAFTYAGVCGVPGTNAGVRITQNVLDAAGNSYVTGDFSGDVTFGNVALPSSGSQSDMFTAKLDAAGNVLWVVRVVGAFGCGIAVDAGGNAYVTGGFLDTATFGPFSLVSRVNTRLSPYGRNVFVAKLNPAGAFVWAVRAGGDSEDIGNGIALDTAGNIYVCGRYTGGLNANAADFGATRLSSNNYYYDIFAAKLDPAGNFLWAAGGGSFQADQAYGIAVDATGNAYVTGFVNGSFGTVVRFGAITATVQGDEDAFVAKLSPVGIFQWVAVGGGSQSPEEGRRIALDAQGAVHIVGDFAGPAYFGPITVSNSSFGFDIFVATLTSAGVWQQVVTGGGTGDDIGSDLALDAAGNTYVVGQFGRRATFGSTVLTTPGDQDIVVFKLNPAGAYVWAIQAGGSGNDEALSAALDARGGLVLAGDTRSGLAVFGSQGFGGTPPFPMGFVARLAVGPLATTSPRRLPALALWPNPAHSGEVLHLSGLTTKQPIEVLDVLGRVVLTMPVLNPGTAAITIPASLGAGVYLVRAGEQQVGRVIVQ